MFEDNLSTIHPPKITSSSVKSYVKITFFPDFQKFGYKDFTDDMVAVLEKRVYDLTAVTPPDVTVTLNGVANKIKKFETYVDLYVGTKAETPRSYETVNDRWQIAVCLSPDGQHRTVSFVNGISTSRGGSHVNYVVNQITKKLVDHIAQKKKKTVRASFVKDNLWVYVNAAIENASFDSQIKEFLTTPVSKFGSKCEISEKFIEKLAKDGIVDRALEMLQAQDTKELKKTDGKKKSSIRGIPKLEDAVWAGGSKSSQCTLILCEGDSAKTFAVSGLSVVGREAFGIFPLRGKLLNVREASPQQLANNVEFAAIKTILGLSHGKVYQDTKELRYGGILILTDADLDGSHIKGLIMNMIHVFWPSLLTNVNGFVRSMLTPIIKVTKGKEVQAFYTLTEYNTWKSSGDRKNWLTKYFKGLGTSKAEEAREYFRNLDESQVNYVAPSSEECTKSIRLAFDKKHADMRKQWLLTYEPDVILEQTQKTIPIPEFVNKELIHFSNCDNQRSIPSIVDGFKPSQRKVFYGCLKKNLKSDMKVSQLSGAIAEVSAYHFGDASLQGTIIGMAQNYVGTNNINLLSPEGQFGTRLMGGKDAASPRYIFTKIDNIAKTVFHADDLPILRYLDDDGFSIEPAFYVPIIPMVLVNGANGIGTGFSTQVPQHNPLDVASNILAMLDDRQPEDIKPWYRGFDGCIEAVGENSFVTKGKWNRLSSDTMEITELPIGKWTDDFKEFLEGCTDPDVKKASKVCIKSYQNYSTEARVKFVVEFSPEKLENLLEKGQVESDLRLTTTLNTSNMHLYNAEGRIQKYKTIIDIQKAHYDVRLKAYQQRKDYVLARLRREINILRNKVRFIESIIDGTLDIFRKSKSTIDTLLHKANYDRERAGGDAPNTEEGASYSYLVNMQISSFTQEKIADLVAVVSAKELELVNLEGKSIKTIWKEDLTSFMEEYQKRIGAEQAAEEQISVKPTKPLRGRKKSHS